MGGVAGSLGRDKLRKTERRCEGVLLLRYGHQPHGNSGSVSLHSLSLSPSPSSCVCNIIPFRPEKEKRRIYNSYGIEIGSSKYESACRLQEGACTWVKRDANHSTGEEGWGDRLRLSYSAGVWPRTKNFTYQRRIEYVE